MSDPAPLPTALTVFRRYLADLARQKRPLAEPGRSVLRTFRGAMPDDRRLHRYLDLTGAGRIERLLSGASLPPTITALWEAPVILELLRIAGLPLPVRGLTPANVERVQIRTLSPGEALEVEARLGPHRHTGNGVRLTVELAVRNRLGQPCTTTRLTLHLLESASSPGAPFTDPPGEIGERDREGWRTVRGWTFDRTVATRYAWLSGDLALPYLSTAAARLAGFERRILHWGCTEALIAHALIEDEMAGEPGALRRLATTFTAPVGVPSAATLRVRRRSGGGEFRLIAGRDAVLLALGEWAGGQG